MVIRDAGLRFSMSEGGGFSWFKDSGLMSACLRLRLHLVGGMEKWKDGKLWEDGKYLVFPLVCLVGVVEKWEGEKLFYLVGEKKGRMENVIYIN